MQMNLQAKQPEKKKRKKKMKNSSPPPSPPSFSSLPNEIAVNCLARISRSYYARLSIVSKSFQSIVSSTELYAARSHLGSTEQCLYVCLWDESYEFPQWFTLWINPNRTLPNSMIRKKKNKKAIGQLLVPITCSNFPSVSTSSIVVGSEIYVIGGRVGDYEPSSAVRILDCRSHTWRDAPSMNVARKHTATCFYDGKIYVNGGCRREEEESWGEVFDIKTQTWERISLPNTELCKSFLYRIEEIQGKIYFGSSRQKYVYDPKQGKWESFNDVVKFPKSGCVIDGVWYMRNNWGRSGYYDLQWSTDKYCRTVKGLDSLGDMYRRNGGSSHNTTKLVSCGGKLYLIWEGYTNGNPKNRKKIWCAEIVVEKRDEGEVWGHVEWVDVVRSVPTSCELLDCLVVSV